MTPDDLRRQDCILLECLSGSRAYGTDTPESDTDIRGIFIASPEQYYGLDQPRQINDDTNDTTFYEIGRFIELLITNNPNILELIFTSGDAILHRSPLLAPLVPGDYLSKLCEQTFAGYAVSQIRKARGLNKKIVNPEPQQRRPALDFCYVIDGQRSIPLDQFLKENRIDIRHCALVNISHMRDVHALFHDPTGEIGYRGIFKNQDATEVRFSSVPKGAQPIAHIAYNPDAFKKHCRQHKEYWQWVENRNDARYNTNVEHGKNYDSKNLMHTFRLLDMAEEIARERTLTVRRPNIDFLMTIRRGEFEYDDLIEMAEEKIEKIAGLYQTADLPEKPDRNQANTTLVEIRHKAYQ
ncbi:MAG: hypothetical protein ACI9UA_004308 [Pseudoalteromonas tetraodonis]|jgi:hypothetical protein